MSKLCFLWRTLLKKICNHYSWNMGKMWCFKLHSWKKLYDADRNQWKKMQQMKTLSPKIMAKETGYWIFKGLAQNVWATGTQIPLQHCLGWCNQAVPLWHPSQTIQSDVGSWWRKETSCALTRFLVPETTIFFFFFSTDRVQSWLTIDQRKSTFTATYCVETVLTGVIK